jgi:hypothetical protein
MRAASHDDAPDPGLLGRGQRGGQDLVQDASHLLGQGRVGSQQLLKPHLPGTLKGPRSVCVAIAARQQDLLPQFVQLSPDVIRFLRVHAAPQSGDRFADPWPGVRGDRPDQRRAEREHDRIHHGPLPGRQRCLPLLIL